MRLHARVILVAAALSLVATAGWAQLAPYSQDFEGVDPDDPGALAGIGWIVFGNVFDNNGFYRYGYGTFPAPNGTPGFSSVIVGEGQFPQGEQQMVVYSDYNNLDHARGWLIEANVFQEQWPTPGDVGQTWRFEFDAARRDLGGGSSALAFIKTLDPAAGFALTNFITVDMTHLPPEWDSFQLEIFIDETLPGQILQFGFLSAATFYEPSGILYDNINFARAPIPVDFDVRPGSCPNPLNNRSQGLLPTAVLGTADFDVTQIDLATLQVEGVAPIRSGFDDVAAPYYGDVADNACGCAESGPDGFMDLELKFETADLGLAAADGKLTLTGNLLDGTPIEGTDCIVLVGRRDAPTSTTSGVGGAGGLGFERNPLDGGETIVTDGDDDDESRRVGRPNTTRRSPTRFDR
jgi:hypothetical protein